MKWFHQIESTTIPGTPSLMTKEDLEMDDQVEIRSRRCHDCREEHESIPEKTCSVGRGIKSTMRGWLNAISGKKISPEKAKDCEIYWCRRDLYLGKEMYQKVMERMSALQIKEVRNYLLEKRRDVNHKHWQLELEIAFLSYILRVHTINAETYTLVDKLKQVREEKS